MKTRESSIPDEAEWDYHYGLRLERPVDENRLNEFVDRQAASCHHSVILGNIRTRNMMQRSPFERCTVVCFNEEKIAALKKQLPAEKDLQESARRHKVLGHPARQAILHILSSDECCVCDIAEVLGKPVSTVSQHLRTLVAEAVLEYRQEGKLVFYSLTRDARAEAKHWAPAKEGRQ